MFRNAIHRFFSQSQPGMIVLQLSNSSLSLRCITGHMSVMLILQNNPFCYAATTNLIPKLWSDTLLHGPQPVTTRPTHHPRCRVLQTKELRRLQFLHAEAQTRLA